MFFCTFFYAKCPASEKKYWVRIQLTLLLFFQKFVHICRYPKPGRTNPFVNAFVTRIDRLRRGSPTPLLLAPPKYFDDKERLIYSVTWATNEELSLTWETRHQNYSLVSICDTLANCKDSLVMHRQCTICRIFTILLTFLGKSCNEYMLHTSGVCCSYKVSGPSFEFRKVVHASFNTKIPVFTANSGYLLGTKWQKWWFYKSVRRIMKIVHSVTVL